MADHDVRLPRFPRVYCGIGRIAGRRVQSLVRASPNDVPEVLNLGVYGKLFTDPGDFRTRFNPVSRKSVLKDLPAGRKEELLARGFGPYAVALADTGDALLVTSPGSEYDAPASFLLSPRADNISAVRAAPPLTVRDLDTELSHELLARLEARNIRSAMSALLREGQVPELLEQQVDHVRYQAGRNALKQVANHAQVAHYASRLDKNGDYNRIVRDTLPPSLWAMVALTPAIATAQAVPLTVKQAVEEGFANTGTVAGAGATVVFGGLTTLAIRNGMTSQQGRRELPPANRLRH